MKNKRAVKILFALLIILFFALVSKSINFVEAETATFGQDFSHAYTMSGSWVAYCREHGKALGGDIGGLTINELHFEKVSDTQKIEPATGYALYCGESGQTLQDVMWYSKIWTEGSNSVVDADTAVAGIQQRYKAYGDVYYGIIKPFNEISDPKKSLFTITSDTKDENVKIMVNQQNKKYIVGPYKIQLNPSVTDYKIALETLQNPVLNARNSLSETLKNSGIQNNNLDLISDSLMHNDANEEYFDINKLFSNGLYNVSIEAKQELYNELINWKNINKPFAKFEINKDLLGINGDPNSYKFLDSNGNEIQFPDFVSSKEFYIEFTPNNDGNIQYVGTPNIKIQWLDDFSYSVDGAWQFKEAVSINGVPTDYKLNGGPTKEENYSNNGEDDRPTFHKEQPIKIPVYVGKSRTHIGDIDGTLYYYSTSCREDTETDEWTDEKGHTHRYTYHVGWIRTGGWTLDVQKSSKNWTFSGKPYVIQRIDGKIEITGSFASDGTGHWGEVNSNIAVNKSCNVQIGGTVWLESPEQKTANIDGKLGSGDVPFAGIQVQLYDVTQGYTAVIGDYR